MPRNCTTQSWCRDRTLTIALIDCLFSGATLDLKTCLLHPNRAANVAIAEKSHFVLNGAMDRHGIRV